MTWKSKALGVATLNALPQEQLVIQHVSLSPDGAALTGSWLFNKSNLPQTRDLLAHWIPVGDDKGIKLASAAVNARLPRASIVELLAACQSAEASLRQDWEDYRAADIKKRHKLVPIRGIAWPEVKDHESPTQALKAVGAAPHPPNTPKEMRTPLAFARLVQYIGNRWNELEVERTSRRYLSGKTTDRNVLPLDWLEQNPPWWPVG